VRRDLGDFQTPPELVAAILESLGPIGVRWPRVLEPTCGSGHFIGGLLNQMVPPREIQAIEIQEDHVVAARALALAKSVSGVQVRITEHDFFKLELKRDLSWIEEGPLLVIGNPPWVTSAELGRLTSAGGPPRRNLKSLPGLAARTGASNFDVAEAVWLKLIVELAELRPTIALLCKTSVARRILQFTHHAGLPVEEASIRRINAAFWFGAAVDACCFRVTIGAAEANLKVPVFADLIAAKPESVLGFSRGWLIASGEIDSACSVADGVCPLTWRQGIKHDVAEVMELAREPGSSKWRNKTGEIVDVELKYVYPLIKGSDLTRSTTARTERALVITQKRLGDDTTQLAETAPRLWRYLQSHEGSFARRRSSIYRGRPPFSLFGIGPYSFAPFKVAVFGMQKEAKFQAVGPAGGRAVMFDDTCYFLPCSTAEEAAALAALCNDPITLGFLSSASFRDAKRPITKTLLQRIDLMAILKRADRQELAARAWAILSGELGAERSTRISEVIDRINQDFSQAKSTDAGRKNPGPR
jgi:hypothetical protein